MTYRPRIISGAQTGADQGGLSAALLLGLKTGGSIPKGGRTDEGFQPGLIAQYGLIETADPGYRTRTIANAYDADATIWFGNINSPGGRLTFKTVRGYSRPLCAIPFPPTTDGPNPVQTIIEFLSHHHPQIINIAGNRQRTNPGIFLFTRRTLYAALKELIS